jgi:acetyl-CoA C-acetyltransferase
VIFACEGIAEKITPTPAWIHATANRHMYSDYSDVVRMDSLLSMVEASQELWAKLGVREPRKELDVIELYQPYSWAGMMWIEDMGLCKKGEGPQLIWDGVTDMGGELPINPSGGVVCTNPIGATGLIRAAEVAIQIQGKGGKRQVPDVNLGVSTGFGGNWWTDMIAFGKKKPD